MVAQNTYPPRARGRREPPGAWRARRRRCTPAARGRCVDVVFKLSYGNMLYIGKPGHFTLKRPNFPQESTKPNSVTPSALERRHKKHTYLFRSPHRPNSITPSVLERWHKKRVHLLSGAGGGRRVHGARARRRCVRSCTRTPSRTRYTTIFKRLRSCASSSPVSGEGD